MAEPDRSREPGPRRTDWLRVTDGLFLLGLGVFALLNASGRLPWTFWYDALSLWPLLLVSAGLRIAVERTRRTWLAVLGPVMVLATLAGLAAGRLDTAPGPWQPVSVRAERAARLRLHAKLASSRLDVTARPLEPGVVLDGRQGSRDGEARVEATREEGDPRLVLKGADHGWGFLRPGHWSRWELGVPEALPVELEMDGAMIGGRFDLAHGRVQSGDFKGVFLGLDVRLPRPTAPVQLAFRGVFNTIDVYVPPGTPVRVRGVGFPFNLVDRGTGGDPTNPATPGYEVKFEGIFGRIGVADAAEAPGPNLTRNR